MLTDVSNSADNSGIANKGNKHVTKCFRKFKLKKFLVAFGLLLTFCLIAVSSAKTDEFSESHERNLIEDTEEFLVTELYGSSEEDYNDTNSDSDKNKNIFDKSPNRPSPLTMDLLSLIWYLTTLLALIGFFVVMACTESTCGRRPVTKPEDTRTQPPTPAPSYRLFAPPSYDSVMKKYKSRIFIVPVHGNTDFFHQNFPETNNISNNSSENSIKEVVIEVDGSLPPVPPYSSVVPQDVVDSTIQINQSSHETSVNSTLRTNLSSESETSSSLPQIITSPERLLWPNSTSKESCVIDCEKDDVHIAAR